MSLLVIGTLAFDSVETPYDKRDDALGGSATFFAMSARYFSGVRLVGVVGDDFPQSQLADFRQVGIDTEGVEVADGKSFRWAGRYEADWNTRHTLSTDLNVLEHFDPKIPASYRDTEFVFLANTAPAIQAKALDQLPEAKFVVADTMNLWIDIARDDLLALLPRIDGLVLNDEEARMLTGETHLLTAAKKVLELGPKFCVLKKGEHGAFLISNTTRFALPAYPVDRVVDPTGAGDSFAGGFMGYLAAAQNTHPQTLRRAMVYGTVTASHCVESFSIDALAEVGRSQIESRFNELHELIRL
ncbi:putative sugar kinase YdjH [Planctomycetes bacterium Pla163]|uniref:Putative sugar kinase YdjH n=1 Tax=Rohdeia mirabilis TaxID=2528008 RepID=A0A518D0L7_9BACT|nr:putative sugar kinase YdjH [Planctomycetes bacterium Pla163]